MEFVLDALNDYVDDAPRDVLLWCERMAARLEVPTSMIQTAA